MYPLEHVYSRRAFDAWRHGDAEKKFEKDKHGSRAITADPFWEVSSWDELRTAISFLTLMNKRQVLYYRGQGAHFEKCLPVLFREEWVCDGKRFSLRKENRGEYYAQICSLRRPVFEVAKKVGTPRTYILEHLPAATASILQHYELWPTHLIDITRSLSIAVSFAEGDGKKANSYLYVFGMPDLRGSITSDIDQQLTLARLEAICPPGAKRPHHQDAYLVSRFPEPPGVSRPGDADWDDWQRKTDLMRRLVAKFKLVHKDGKLTGTPRIERTFLTPPLEEDLFGRELSEKLLPDVLRLASEMD